jgi:predicted RNA-binding Zn-ribbon protein involved in translation (DUF1610 family)
MAKMGDIPECGQCGYELTGLADVGQCPECGSEYDVGRNIGLRTSAGARKPKSWPLRHLRTITITLAGGCVLMCAGLVSLAARNPHKVWGSTLVVLIVIGIAAAASYLGERNPD